MNSLWLLVGVVLIAVGFGLWRKWSDGRLREDSTGSEVTDSLLSVNSTPGASEGQQQFDAQTLGILLGSQATLVQFSSAFCQPCRSARLLLANLADDLPHQPVRGLLPIISGRAARQPRRRRRP